MLPLVLERWTAKDGAYGSKRRIPHRLAYYPREDALVVEFVNVLGFWLPCWDSECLPIFRKTAR